MIGVVNESVGLKEAQNDKQLGYAEVIKLRKI